MDKLLERIYKYIYVSHYITRTKKTGFFGKIRNVQKYNT